MVDDKTRICASIAHPTSNLGCLIHNAGFQELGLNYIYFALDVTDVENAIKGMKALNIRGFSVSMPHKLEVMKYLNNIDETAQTIGAVNTVVNNDGVLTGYNSDWIGAATAIGEVTEIKGKKALVIGAGGAARAVVFALKEKGADVTVINRTKEKADELAQHFSVKSKDFSELDNAKNYDIVANATPVGMINPEESILKKEQLREGQVIFDTVFKPLKTTFIKIAEEAGCKTAPGWKMLLNQALFQFEKYTGQKPPVKIMEKKLLEALDR